jgi:hypothetical protein
MVGLAAEVVKASTGVGMPSGWGMVGLAGTGVVLQESRPKMVTTARVIEKIRFINFPFSKSG